MNQDTIESIRKRLEEIREHAETFHPQSGEGRVLQSHCHFLLSELDIANAKVEELKKEKARIEGDRIVAVFKADRMEKALQHYANKHRDCGVAKQALENPQDSIHSDRESIPSDEIVSKPKQEDEKLCRHGRPIDRVVCCDCHPCIHPTTVDCPSGTCKPKQDNRCWTTYVTGYRPSDGFPLLATCMQEKPCAEHSQPPQECEHGNTGYCSNCFIKSAKEVSKILKDGKDDEGATIDREKLNKAIAQTTDNMGKNIALFIRSTKLPHP